MTTAQARDALATRQPRFALSEVGHWAERYAYAADEPAIDELAATVRERGHFLRDEFLEAYRWKTHRTAHHVVRYTNEEIVDVTALAFRQPNEQLRISLLLALKGVDWAVASALLHIGLSADYPILDFRALWSLHSAVPPSLTFDFWWEYVSCCRAIAEAAGTTVRELDKALWAFSKANQPAG